MHHVLFKLSILTLKSVLIGNLTVGVGSSDLRGFQDFTTQHSRT